MTINKEKQEIIKQKGNILVTANPGTGKTLLLAHKYISLLENGLNPAQILCLTFTDKAKREMEERIIKLIKECGISVDLSKLNIFTFHSYALNNLGSGDIISANLLRFSIFRYLKENEILAYGDPYLIDTVVPKMENLIRYLKSFGITPDQIDIDKAKSHLVDHPTIGRKELEKFVEDFVEVFKHYESIKISKGVDYSDLLIKFLELQNPPLFEFVLIDELQDVNKMEAEIALKSGKQFFAVGDKKQAIFGFQGGSIINFEMFKNSSQSVLSENFRSTDQILSYAKEYFVTQTKDESHKQDLEKLRNAEGKKGSKPLVMETDKNSMSASACNLVNEIVGRGKKVAVIARTNNQILQISKELSENGIDFSSTFFSASDEARRDIINFLKGMLSTKIEDVKNSMFTPFSPIPLQKAFSIAERDIDDLKGFLVECPELANLRNSVKNVEDVKALFRNHIVPISISYGKEYYIAALKMMESYIEALFLADDKKMSNLINYLQSSDLLTDEPETEAQVVLTTVHKAKGKEFDNVIYIPAQTGKRSNFQDMVVEAILKSKGINAEEELEEETLRINFVAFSRAKDNLYVLTDKVSDYLNDYSESTRLENVASENIDFGESKRKAYTLFVNKDFERAKELLETKKSWLFDFVKRYFDSLDSISFSSLPENAYDYLVDYILGIREYSPALTRGSNLHKAAENILKGEDYEASDELIPLVENVKELVGVIKKDYPEIFQTEEFFSVPINQIAGSDHQVRFNGKIDAVFKNHDNYLIVDWKTDRNNTNASKHRQQLESYKRSFSAINGLGPENVKVAIGYVGLRSTINTGEINAELDMRQPGSTAFDTFMTRVQKILDWKENPKLFFEQLLAQKRDYYKDALWRSVVEQYRKETERN